MPEYRCQNCGTIWYGWGSKGICQKCGGKLDPMNESAERRIARRREEGTLDEE